MTKEKIKNILEKAGKDMLSNQPTLFEFSSETHQSEWNLGHHLANEISKVFTDYDCDLDIIKSNYDNKRPDIIFHKRGSQEDNFLVIELKRYMGDMKSDLDKIKNYWFSEPLSYQFGASVVITDDQRIVVEVIKNVTFVTF